MKKNINVKIMGVFATVLLLVIVITASFAYFGSFNVKLNNNVTVNVNSVSPGNATFTSNATQLNLQVPAANMSFTAADNSVAAASNTATLTVNLTGAANLLTTCTYDIVYEYDSTSSIYGGSQSKSVAKNGNKEITLQVLNVNGTNSFTSEKNFDYDSNWSGLKRTLVSGATIESDGTLTTQNISITGKYYNLTISQSSLEGKTFAGKIYVTNHRCETIKPAYMTILENNTINQKIPDFSVIATTNYGLYKAEDDLGTSYYFRGAVNNNWVQFGKDNDGNDIYWRIIRINGNGSIRMIYSGTIVPSTDSSVKGSKGVYITGNGIRINESQFNGNRTNAEYVGYQYMEGQQHGFGKCNGTNISCTVNGNIVYNSKIKQEIDKWYAETTLETDAATKALVSQDQIFCNDRSASSTQTTAWTSTGAIYYYGAYNRLLNNKKPILTCPIESDKFTVNTSNGNGALTYPVGLITADEVAMAGGVMNKNNSSYYLYTNHGYWLGTSLYFNGNNEARGIYLGSSGSMTGASIHYAFDVRPVISLSPKAQLLGSGTYNDVYTVS